MTTTNDMELARMLERLREGLPNGRKLTGIRQLSGGHSNSTYVLDGLDEILRLPPEGAALLESGYSVIEQQAIIRELGTSRLRHRVPVITFVDATGTILGTPFFTMSRLPGKPWADWKMPEWVAGRPPEFFSAICREAVDCIAELHALPPLDALGEVRSNATEIRRWRDSIDGIDRARAFDEACELLIANAPPVENPAPVHNDPKLANMLFEDSRITALLDWELSFNGDPGWDISYLAMPFSAPIRAIRDSEVPEGLWTDEMLYERWSQKTGRSIARRHWYDAATYVFLVAIHTYGYHLFVSGKVNDPRYEKFIDSVPEFTKLALSLARADAATLAKI